MTIWAFNKPDEEEEGKIEFLSKSLKQGIARFGWGWSDADNLKKLAQQNENEMSEVDKIKFKNKFLLEIKKGDWIVQINVPQWGIVTAGKVIEEYDFEETDNAVRDFRHFFKLEPNSIIEFDRNDPNVDPEISKRLKLQGRYWRIHLEELFLQSISQLKNKESKNFPKIRRFNFSNFLNFNNTEIEFSPSINLIIGKNNTGKTNLLKFLYAIIKSSDNFIKQKKLYDRTYKSILSKNIQEIFQSSKEGIGTIVSKNSSGNFNAIIDFSDASKIGVDKIQIVNNQIRLNFGKTTKKDIQDVEFSEFFDTENDADFNTIFIPAKEILSITEAIKRTFKEYIKGFDATYFDLADIVVGPSIEQSGIQSEFRKITENIQNDIIDGKIEFDEEEKELVYKNKAGQKFELTMTAEGIKQVGMIPLLINRGKLNSRSILFLDEPDNNLNPVTINKFVKVLVDLAKAGVQIFISSHNYFIIKRLHIYAKQFQDIDFRAYSLIDYQDNSKIDIETKDLKLGLPKYNPIVDEAIKMFNDELLLEINS